MLDPVSLGIGGVTSAAKLGLAAYQAYRASKLKLADTTTPEQREMLENARQQAASLRVPGQAMLENRLGMGQNVAVQAAQLGAGSGSDYLASVAATNMNRVNGEMQLGAQREQFNGQAQQQLRQQLGLQAQQRQRDLATFNTTKANLTGAAIQNANSAIDSGAAYAAYGIGRGADSTGPAGAVDELTPRDVALNGVPGFPSPGIRGLGLSGYRPALTGGRYATSRNRFGLTY